MKLLNLANSTGLSQPFLSELERGVKVASLSTIEKICVAFNITLSQFFDDGTSPQILTNSELELIQNSKNLTEEQFDKLNEFVKSINSGI